MSDESLLIERVTAGANSSDRMPPPSEGVALGDHEIGDPSRLDRSGSDGPGRGRTR